MCCYGQTTNPDLDSRLSVLQEIFTTQLNAYLPQLERLERTLSAKKNQHTGLLEQVRAALSGTGSLWFAPNQPAKRSSTSLLTRQSLARFWPGWATPLPLLRHLFASSVARFGLS